MLTFDYFRNNHLKQHRQQLRETASNFNPPARLIALNWSLDSKPPAMVHRVCSDRIITRGANHQTLIADTSQSRSHEDVVWMFINNHEDLAEQEVDACVDMEIEDDLEEMVKCAVDGLWKLIGGPDGMLGGEKPDVEKIREAVAKVGEYKAQRNNTATAIKEAKDTRKGKEKEDKPPRYYGLLPELDLDEVLGGVFTNVDAAEGKWKDGAEFWNKLKKGKRLSTRPHITIVHSKSLPDEQDVWDHSAKVHAALTSPLFECNLGKVLWDGRVMVLTVDKLELVSDSEEGEGKRLLEVLPEATRRRLHVTVGTENAGIPAVEGKMLVERWRDGEKEDKGVYEIDLGEVVVTGRLKGLSR